MASIREVAKLAHVAPSTVSRALNGSGYVSEKSKNKIKKAVEELDYIPNQWIRNLYKKRTGIIGVMTPDIIHPYFSTLWNYLEAELDQYGYNVVICNTRGNQDNYSHGNTASTIMFCGPESINKDRKSTRLNSSHNVASRMPSSA